MADLWQKLKDNRAWLIPICAVVVAVSGWFISADYKVYLDHKNDPLYRTMDDKIATALTRPGGVEETLQKIQTTTERSDATLKALQPFIQDIVTRQFESVSKLSGQALVSNLPAVNHLVAIAVDQKVGVNPNFVTKVGRELINVSIAKPEAWTATNGLLGYFSILNEGQLPPDLELVGRPNFATLYSPPDGWSGQLQAAGMGNSPKVAELRHIGFPDANAGKPTGPSYLIMNGGIVDVDGMIMSRVLIRNATIVYNGDPVSLKSVYFVNCKFQVKSERQGQQFASAVLTAPAVNFAA